MDDREWTQALDAMEARGTVEAVMGRVRAYEAHRLARRRRWFELTMCAALTLLAAVAGVSLALLGRAHPNMGLVAADIAYGALRGIGRVVAGNAVPIGACTAAVLAIVVGLYVREVGQAQGQAHRARRG